MEMRKQLVHHDKINDRLFDYYSEDKEWLVTYKLTVDGKTVYEEDEPLNEVEMKRMLKYYSQL